jgi:hypothetical protein
MKDLFHQDVVEMIERETRSYEFEAIEHPSHPDFERAYGILWSAFGGAGEMEPIDAIRGFLLDDPYEPVPSGTYIRYFLLVARDKNGVLRGVRDGCVLYNPAYAPDLCMVYLAHIFVLPEARGTVLTYWLRIAPVELAMHYLHELHARGRIALPLPEQPGKYYGMRLDLAAEMEYFSPEDPISLQRILFYGRGGFDVIDPRHFPYRQPDFRPPAMIQETGNTPIPFMLLLRRMGRERQAKLPLDEARAVMRLLYDDFAFFCAPEFLENSLDVVLQRLEERQARGKNHVDLLPLPTGARDLQRLKRVYRHDVYQRFYKGDPATLPYLEAVRARIAANPRWFEDELAALARRLETRVPYVYGSRDKDVAWEGTPTPEPADAEPEPPHAAASSRRPTDRVR